MGTFKTLAKRVGNKVERGRVQLIMDHSYVQQSVGHKLARNDFLIDRIIREDMDQIFGCGIDWQKLNGKTILVSGAYGMLASYFVYFLIYLNEIKGLKIKITSLSRNVDKLKNRFGKYISKPYFTNISADINKALRFDNNIDTDFIIHAASLASSQYYMVCPHEVALPNVLGTYNLLKVACQKRCESFLFFSTGSVYGKIDKPLLREDEFGAIDPLDIHSCYDESKRMGETFCKIYAHQFGVKTKIARFGHTYGPTLDIENDKRVFSEFVKNVVLGEDIEMKSDGTAKRAFCYIADATAAEFKILLDGNTGEAYNVVNTEQVCAIRDLAAIIAKLGNVKFIQMERVGDYLEAPFAGIGDSAKLKHLGWKCKYDIEEGFRRTIKSIKRLYTNA